MKRVLALGTFDGMHLGHQAIIARARELAAETGSEAGAYTFASHPLAAFGREPALLMSDAERLRAIADEGVLLFTDVFDRAFAATQCEDFVRSLMERFGMCAAVAGFNYTFGNGGKGDVDMLRALGERLGFAVAVVPPVVAGGAPVSSSRIRALLEQGDAGTAAALLSRPYSLCGEVVSNRRIGHALGFPTANLSFQGNRVIPGGGVYATRARALGAVYPAVTNIGRNPTVHGRSTTIETHLIGFDGDLYGESLSVEFISRMRGEICFSTTAALAAQIASDVEKAMEILGNA